MAYLFFNELGNKAYYDASGNPQAGYGVTNAGPFQNLQSYVYWSGTEYAPISVGAWYFSTSNGNQGALDKFHDLYAWAVRPGDVAAAPVPRSVSEPETLGLLAIGLLGLGLARRRG